MKRLAPLLSSCHLYALTAILLWASSNVLIRAYTSYFDPAHFSALRFVFAGAFMLALVLLKRIPPPERRDLPWVALAGFCGFVLYTISINIGMKTVTASTSSLVVATAPVMTALFAALLFSEKLPALGWLAIGIEFCGIAVLTLMNGGLSVQTGLLWCLLSAFAMCCYNLLQRRLTRKYSALRLTAYGIFAAALVQLPFMPGALSSLREVPPAALAAVAFLGIGSSGLGYLSWSKGLSLARSTSEVTNWMFLNPLLTTLLGFVVILETPDTATLLGGVIILAGLLLFGYAKRPKAVAAK